MRSRTATTLTYAALCLCGIPGRGHGEPMTLRPVVLTETPVAGVPPEVTFSQFVHTAINSSGRVVFIALVQGDGVTTENEIGIWSEGENGLRLVARAGDVPPGVQEGVFFSVFNPPVINSVGRAAFSAFLAGPNVDDSSDQGLWTETDGGLVKHVREGDPVTTRREAAMALCLLIFRSTQPCHRCCSTVSATPHSTRH